MTEAELIAELSTDLERIGFRSNPSSEVLGCWIRRRPNTNRAVVLLRCPEGVDAAVFARESRSACARSAGFYIPLLYGIGLQVVVVGGDNETAPTDVVDRYDNQWCCLQSVFLVDIEAGTVDSGRTWGQTTSSPIQAAILRALAPITGEHRGAPSYIASVSTPRWVSRALSPRSWWRSWRH